MNEPRRKLRKTYNDPGHAHYLTFSCHERLPLLSRPRTCEWVVDSLDKARKKLNFRLWAYVLMPEHAHLLVCPQAGPYSIERFLFALKRPVAWRAKQWLIANRDAGWLQRLTVLEAGRDVFRFWQAGGGYDRNVREVESARKAIEYIHGNPVRRGLVEKPEDWLWSSAGFYSGRKEVPIVMDPLNL
jgi:putative transposase